MSGKVNMYNMWQKFCASVNIPKDQVKTLYDANKNEIKSTNPSLWYDLIKKNNTSDSENTNDVSLPQHENDMLKDIYITLKEIKTFLMYLSSEPSRHVKSYINLEEKTDEIVLCKWAEGIKKIMLTLLTTEQFNGNNLIIDLKQIYNLISENLFSVPQINKSVEVTFYPITNESDTRIKILFQNKRLKYSNEFLIPTILKDEMQRMNVYFFYSMNELIHQIDLRYRSELVFHTDYITTSQSRNVEYEYYTTHIIYFVLHAMLHLHCSILFKDSFMNHNDFKYYKTVEKVIPKTLYKFFLAPHID